MAGQIWHSGRAKQRQRNGVGRVPVVSRGPTSCLVAVGTDSAARGDTARRTLGRGRLTTVLLALARARRAGRPGWWELGAGGWAGSGKPGRQATGLLRRTRHAEMEFAKDCSLNPSVHRL